MCQKVRVKGDLGCGCLERIPKVSEQSIYADALVLTKASSRDLVTMKEKAKVGLFERIETIEEILLITNNHTKNVEYGTT